MEFLIILFLLVLNGIFAMYEIALVSSSKARLETLAGKGNKSARGVLKQLEEPEKFLSTIQIGITLIGIVSGAYGGVAIDYHSSNHHLPLSYHRRAGTQIHCPQQSGTVRNSVQSDYDFIDESFLPVRLAA